MEFDFEKVYESGVNIKVVGVGGGGNNAVNRMIASNIQGVEFIAVNTDSQALNTSCAAKKLVIGEKITRGKGAGSNPDVGKRSAEESMEQLKQMLEGADMVFITTGMGGGTGTGAAPVIARVAKEELDILTVGIVTKPFAFEGHRRMAQAERGIEELAKHVDSLIVIPNERLKQVEDTHITLANAFEIADSALRRGVQSVSDLVNRPGFINLDFADVTAIMKNAGYAHMGVGYGKGADKARLAALAAIKSPLLETSIAGARGVLVNITTSLDIPLDEVDLASSMIHDEAHPDANIIWGQSFDPDMTDEMRVTIIATGFDSIADNEEPAAQPEKEEVAAPAQPVYQTPARVEPAPAQPVYQTPARVEPAPAQPVYQTPARVEPAPAQPVYQTPARVEPTPVQPAPAPVTAEPVQPTYEPIQPATPQVSIPQSAPEKNEYQEYQTLFTCIKKIKKDNG